jgi:D-alanyl-D-alanine carboxypeptidase
VARTGVLAFVTALVVLVPAVARAEGTRFVSVSADSVLLLDPDGRVLYAKNPDDSHAPASLVKMMTLYLALEDIELGRVGWDDPVTISRRATFTPRYRMGLRAGERVPLRVLLDGVGIASANDAATAVAEYLADGDEEAFVARMNVKAHELGLVQTRFTNPHGLPDPFQRSTATDLAELTLRLMRDYPVSRTILGGQTFIYRSRVYARHIPLFADPGGVQALKTGYTQEAGYNLAVAAWRGGQQFLMIVLGAQSRSLSFLDAKKILRYGFIEAGLEAEMEEPRPVPVRKPTRVRSLRSYRR